MIEPKEGAVLIVGAGPAGLAMAGELTHRGIPYRLIEKAERVGHCWHQHYDRLHLHTVKELSHLPHLPFPEDYPRFVSREQLCDYMEAYARHFDIQPYFGEALEKLERQADGWLAYTNQGAYAVDQVVMATGVNRVPFRPKFKGEDAFRGSIIHSRDYRNPQPFLGEKVLVIGMGNTGAEVALDLAEHEVQVGISVRSPVNIVPLEVFGNPTQLTARKLARLPNWLGDRIGILVRAITVGDLSKYGITTPKMPPAKQLRVEGKTPVIDLGTIEMIKAGKIAVYPDIDHFIPDGAIFADGVTQSFDAVILATGYRPLLHELVPGIEGWVNSDGIPPEPVGSDAWEGLYFLGFDNYTAGGILGVINRDVRVIADHLVAVGQKPGVTTS